MAKNPFLGEWRITDTDDWEGDALDLVGPATLVFGPDQVGELYMIAIEADIDYRLVKRDGKPAVEFSLIGTEEGDTISGRGWAVLSKGSLYGHLYFHCGDDSAFLAERAA